MFAEYDRKEHGFWVYKHKKVDVYLIKAISTEGATNLKLIVVEPPGGPASFKLVAFVHTHPNPPSQGWVYMGPSAADFGIVTPLNIGGIVQTFDGLKYYGSKVN